MAVTVLENVSTDASCTVSNQAVQLVLPANCKYLIARFNTNVGKFSFFGTDGVAIGANYMQASAGVVVRIPTDGFSSLYIATITVPTTVNVWAVPK